MAPPLDRLSGRPRLLLGAAALAAVWLVVLPALGTRSGIAERVRALEAAGVDPAALFYTDHPPASRRYFRVTNPASSRPSSSDPPSTTSIGSGA